MVPFFVNLMFSPAKPKIGIKDLQLTRPHAWTLWSGIRDVAVISCSLFREIKQK